MAPATIPGPTGPDMLRGIRQMRSSPPEFLAACAERFGPVVQFPIPRATVVYLADPSDVRHLLQKNHTNYVKDTAQYSSLALVTGSGSLTSDGDTWLKMRRIVQPAFHTEMVGRVHSAVERSTTDLREQVKTNGELFVTLDELMLEMSLQVVGAALFGGQFGSQGKTLVSAVSDALHVVVKRAQRPWRIPDWLPTPNTRRLTSSLQAIDAAVNELVQSHRDDGDTTSVLAMLLQARADGVISDAQVRDEIVTLIVAGHETVAATLTWTWLLLAAHPMVMQAVREEVDVRPAEAWADDELDGLAFTNAVVDECLRLYPPAWLISRRSKGADQMGAYQIPAGTIVITSPYALHRDPAVWANPLVFQPERFLGDAPDRSVYLPFGAGPRLCIGREMARYEAPLIVASMVREFDIEVHPRGPIGKDFGVTLRPDSPVPARIALRAV